MTSYTSENSSDTQSRLSIPNSPTLPSTLDGLLQQCTVKIRLPGSPRTGTGFFAAPGLILTCSSLLTGDLKQPTPIIWQQQIYSAFIVKTVSTPSGGLTLLQISGSCPSHPSVDVDATVLPQDLLYGYGYSDDFPEGVSVYAEVDSIGDNPSLLHLRPKQHRSNLSGSPLLNWRTGKICGMIAGNPRSPDAAVVAIPTAVILSQFPDLAPQSHALPDQENQWEGAIYPVIANQYHLLGSTEGVVLHPVKSGQMPTLTGLQPDSRPGYGFIRLIDRHDELTQALEAARAKQSIELYGPDGYGKTTLLQVLVAELRKTESYPDGVIYESVGHRPLEDLLQTLFNQLCTGHTLVKFGSGNSAYYLSGRQALVVLDNISVPAAVLQSLLRVMQNSTFIFATRERILVEAPVRAIALTGLASPDSLALVEQRLGQSLSAEERVAAGQLCGYLQGNPSRILQSVALVTQIRATDGQSLSQAFTQVLHRFQKDTVLRVLLSDLNSDQRLVITALTAFADLSLLPQQVASLTGAPHAEDILQSLLERHLVTIHEGRYQLTADLVQDLQSVQLPPWREHILTYFTHWAEQHRAMLPLILSEKRNLMTVLEWAVSQGQWREVLSLARSLEMPLMISGQWQTWEQVLQWGLQATQTLGDLHAEGWTLHQLGSRALSLGMLDTAQDLLNQSLHWRQTLGDDLGIAVTRHNLNQMQPGIPAIQEVPVSQSASTTGRLPVAAGILLLAAGALGVAGSFWFSRLRLPAITSKPAPEVQTSEVNPSPGATPQSPAAIVPPSPIPGPVQPSPAVSPSPTASPTQLSALQFSDPRLGYGDVSTTSGGLFRTLTITNTGPGPVTLQSVAVTGEDAGNFETEPMSTSCKDGLALNAGDSCQIRIFLVPKQNRAYRANLVITHTGSDSPKLIELSGNGV